MSSSPDWDRLWRTAGIQSAGCFVIASVLYGALPGMAASNDTLNAFYHGGRTRIVIATVILGFATLNLLWFAASIRSTLRQARQDGWGAAATASSAVVGGIFFFLIAIGVALAHSIAGSADLQVASALNDLAWTCFVVSSFPRAMLIMSGSFGLWRAGILSNTAFAAAVSVVLLVLAGGTTFAGDGIWAPDGALSRFVSPAVSLVWILAVSKVLLARKPATERAPDLMPVPEW